MAQSDLRLIVPIEREIYEAPWTYGNFRDALAASYPGWVVHNHEQAEPIGYALIMNVLDEYHLLNLSVARAWQGQGVGRQVLEWLIEHAQARGAIGIFLEVRPTNTAAIALYDACGFVRIGLRRNYYPRACGGREDAIVMRRSVGSAS